MSRPWKHPKTGVYWLRKRVPADLVAVIGRAEEKRSLQTKDAAEAKRRHLKLLSEMEGRWANLRVGPTRLTERQAHDLAARIREDVLAAHSDNPSQFKDWDPEQYGTVLEDLSKKLEFNPPMPDWMIPEFHINPYKFLSIKHYRMELLCWEGADETLGAEGLVVEPRCRQMLARAVAAAYQRVSLELTAMAQGDFSRGPRTTAIQPHSESRPSGPAAAPTARPLPFADAIALWVAEKRPAPRTVYEWTRITKALEAFVGHADADRLTADDFIRWKAKMVGAGLKPKTIRDGKLAPVRAILQCAVDNRRLPANPCERIVIDVKSRAVEGRRGYTDAEAATILRAASLASDPVFRWVPWLCAYSGARLSEVCQLRVQDVRQEDGIWCMWFAAEAGSLKNANSERAVPLHEAVLQAGFLDFVRGAPDGPLFPGLPPDAFGRRGGNGTKVLGRFVRKLGLDDPRLAPNHSWRHRFKTAGRRHGLALDIVNAITGHGRKTVADAYGEFPLPALARELAKIPILELA